MWCLHYHQQIQTFLYFVLLLLIIIMKHLFHWTFLPAFSEIMNKNRAIIPLVLKAENFWEQIHRDLYFSEPPTYICVVLLRVQLMTAEHLIMLVLFRPYTNETVIILWWFTRVYCVEKCDLIFENPFSTQYRGLEFVAILTPDYICSWLKDHRETVTHFLWKQWESWSWSAG